MSGQIPLDLSLRPDYSKTRFVPAQSNLEGLSALDRYPLWTNRAVAIIGPAGSGKTHIGHLWISEHEGLLMPERADIGDVGSCRRRAVWIDNAASAQEGLLFAVINMAIREEIDGLLLTDRVPPAHWDVQIPDLRSRLGAMQVARIEPPDDTLLGDVMGKLFMDRGLKVSEPLIQYLLARIDRSVDAAYAVVDQLDKAAASEGVNVTRSFAVKVFGQTD